MKIERAIQLIDQQDQIPHPINTDNVRIIKGIIYYDDGEGRLWVLIRHEGQSLLAFKPEDGNLFYMIG